MPQPQVYVAFGRNDVGFDFNSPNSNDSDNGMAEEVNVPENQQLSKQPRRSMNDLPFQRRGLPISALVSPALEPPALMPDPRCSDGGKDANANGSDGMSAAGATVTSTSSLREVDDDEALPYDNDLRDVNALVHNYEADLGGAADRKERLSAVDSAEPQSQTAFILGLTDLRGLAQEALLDHFAPLADPAPSMQGLTNLDRMPLPRTPARAASVLGINMVRPPAHSNATAAAVAAANRILSTASAPARMTHWPRFVDQGDQDEIDDVFG